MSGKSWPEHLARGSITAAGSNWTLAHLQPHEVIISIPADKGNSAEEVTLAVSYSSHCVSDGPKNEETPINFEICGWDHLVVDHRGVYRAFKSARHELSFQLPQIIATLGTRKCLFTNHANWLTVEGPQLGYPGSMYEVYFTLKRIKGKKCTLNLFVESAYIRDENAPGSQTKFKQHEKVRGWLLVIKTVRNEAIRSPTVGRTRR